MIRRISMVLILGLLAAGCPDVEFEADDGGIQRGRKRTSSWIPMRRRPAGIFQNDPRQMIKNSHPIKFARRNGQRFVHFFLQPERVVY